MAELFEVCKVMGERDKDFVFEFIVDVNGKVENIVWSYGDFVRVFIFFGDVV